MIVKQLTREWGTRYPEATLNAPYCLLDPWLDTRIPRSSRSRLV
jgi:hypothetical protein